MAPTTVARFRGTDGTVKKKEAVIEAIAERFSIMHAAARAGVPRRTLYNWRDDDPTFDAAIIEARRAAIDVLEGSLYERASDNDTTAAIFLLKGWEPARYRERHDVNVSGEVDHTHHLDAASLDGLIERVAAFRSSHADAIETSAAET